MELPSSAYLYTLALLAMTFVGFTAIVMILRQSLGGPLSRFDTLVARFFMAWGFLITYGAMLPPLLAAFELHHPLVWRASSIATGLMLLALSFGYPILRGQATGARAPTFVLVRKRDRRRHRHHPAGECRAAIPAAGRVRDLPRGADLHADPGQHRVHRHDQCDADRRASGRTGEAGVAEVLWRPSPG